jgi:hypothetical protein
MRARSVVRRCTASALASKSRESSKSSVVFAICFHIWVYGYLSRFWDVRALRSRSIGGKMFLGAENLSYSSPAPCRPAGFREPTLRVSTGSATLRDLFAARLAAGKRSLSEISPVEERASGSCSKNTAKRLVIPG